MESSPEQRGDKVLVEAQGLIEAPAARVYEYIADYREHHPKFLPQAFSNLVVERGGVGNGTVISFSLRVGGRQNRMRAMVDEPDPGRVLKEIGLDAGVVTTFVVTPEQNVTRVTIQTELTPSSGLQGWVEKRLAPYFLRRLYAEELANLNRYARQHAPRQPERVLTGVSDS